MVPLKIEIKNFLSYGEPAQIIDFANYNLICLSGKNGNGKSSLIEALTWALWGQARKSNAASKPDYHLVNAGKNHMIVIFDFKVGLQEYQIKREFLKNLKKPLSNLEFYIKNNEKFENISEKTIRDTQEKINSILKTDYETFINSSYLRQANSNEFSKKSPKDRKSILAKILNLSKYDKISQKASDKERGLELELKQNLAMQKQIGEHLLKEDKILEQIKQIQEILKNENLELKEKDLKILETESKLKSLELEQEKFKHQQNLLTEYENQKNEISSSIKKINLEIETLKKKSCFENSLKTKDDPEALTQKISFLEKAREKTLSDQQELINLNKELEEQKNKIKKEFKTEKTKIETNLQDLKIKSAQIEFSIKEKLILIEQIKQENLNYQTKNSTTSMKKEVDLEKKLKRNLISFGEEKKNLEYCQDSIERLKKNCNFLEKKICFACNQKIDNPESFLEKTKKEHLKIEEKKCTAQEILEKLKNEILSQQNQIESEKQLDLEALKNKSILELIKKNDEKINSEKQALLKKQQELDKVKKEINQQEEKQKTLEIKETSNISSDENIKNIEQSISQILKNTNFCKFDKKEYESIKEKIELIKVAEKKEQEQIIIKKEISILSKNKENLEQMLHNLKTKISLQKKPVADSFLEDFKQQKTKHGILKNEISTIKKKVLQQEKIVSELEAEKTFLNKLKVNLEKLTDKFKALQEEKSIYSELNLAFGKNGIQALLIENLIPEIENETNFYLSKISDSKSKVYFESQKELRSGAVKESLEIKICDSKGIREYEMFSGGEAFKIDFAIRVGISKIVAKRAGAWLQTLIIDEGFGSLDDQGIELLTNCIYSIAQDFEKVIIITHLNDFKNSFPVHFLVTKSAKGSKINVELKG